MRLRILARSTLLAGLAAALLAGPVAAAPPAYAAAQATESTTDQPASAAAGWLADQLVDGQFLVFDGTDIPSPGLTIDATLAFAATGVAGSAAAVATDWLVTPDVVAGYLGAGEDEAFAGAHAKLAFGAEVQGLDPTAIGEVDVLAGLLDLQSEDGRFQDRSEFGDFSNAFSQSFAILALAGAPAGGVPAGVLDLAVEFQLSEQCPDGGFPEQFAQDTCTSDVDATAMVVQALLGAGQDPTAALDWLADQQQPDGGFLGAAGVNANSTGLAAQALRAGGRDATADQAVAFLESLQVGCDGPDDQRGSVPSTADEPGDVPRATAQAILGMAGVGMADLDGAGAQAEAPRLRCDPAPSPTRPGGTGGTGGELPVTGDPVLLLVGAGGVLAGAGGLTVWLTRLRRRPVA